LQPLALSAKNPYAPFVEQKEDAGEGEAGTGEGDGLAFGGGGDLATGEGLGTGTGDGEGLGTGTGDELGTGTGEGEATGLGTGLGDGNGTGEEGVGLPPALLITTSAQFQNSSGYGAPFPHSPIFPELPKYSVGSLGGVQLFPVK
jgi:hypothetical protein